MVHEFKYYWCTHLQNNIIQFVSQTLIHVGYRLYDAINQPVLTIVRKRGLLLHESISFVDSSMI